MMTEVSDDLFPDRLLVTAGFLLPMSTFVPIMQHA